jgi:hypothetical protein
MNQNPIATELQRDNVPVPELAIQPRSLAESVYEVRWTNASYKSKALDAHYMGVASSFRLLRNNALQMAIKMTAFGISDFRLPNAMLENLHSEHRKSP